LSIFGKSVEKIQVSLKSDKTTDTLYEDQYEFFIILRPVRFEMQKEANACINVTLRRLLLSVFATEKQ
jgi:hypothetical protein